MLKRRLRQTSINIISYCAIFSVLCLQLLGCGGSGGGGAAATSGGSSTSSDLNSGLNGKLLYNNSESYVELDLATGNVDTVVQGGDTFFAPSEDASTFVAYDKINSNTDKVWTFNRSGNTLSSFEAAYGLSGVPKLSPDGTVVAIRWWPLYEYGSVVDGIRVDRGLAVFGVDNGQLYRFLHEGETDIKSWDWASNGDLIYTHGNTIKRWDVVNNDIAVIYEHNDSDTYFTYLSISPDQSKLAVTMNGGLHWLNMDGSGLRKLATAYKPVLASSWSPDGNYILAVRNGFGSDIPVVVRCPLMFAVSINASSLYLESESIGDMAIAIRHYKQNELSPTCVFDMPTWTN